MPRKVALWVAVLTISVAGCRDSEPAGRSSQPAPLTVADYRAKVTRISTDFAAAGRAFRDSVGPRSTPQQAASALAAFQGRVRRAAVELESLPPPQGVAGAHRDLTGAFRAIAAATQPSIDAGRAGNRTALQASLRRLQSQLNGPLGRRAQAAARRIDAGLAK